MMDFPLSIGQLVQGLKSFTVNCVAVTTDSAWRYTMACLLDSGMSGNFVDKTWAEREQMTIHWLDSPIPVWNVDGTPNKGGPINSEVDLLITIADHQERLTFEVIDLGGKQKLVLGLPWLEAHNLTIDWTKRTITFERCALTHSWGDDTSQLMAPGPTKLISKLKDESHAARVNLSRAPTEPDPEQEQLFENDTIIFSPNFLPYPLYLTLKDDSSKASLTVEEDIERYIPWKYREYVDVFRKMSFDTLPEHSEFNHKIELNDQFTPQCGKIYPISLNEQKALDEFIEENLTTSRIRPLDLPQAAPFFFGNKTDGGLCPIQDYRYLNQHMIQDCYPLPLILEIFDSVKQDKYFTKLDVRWGFNNVRIREGNKLKVAFITNEGLFEPTMMFFGLTNSPATFQQMMDMIFRKAIMTKRVKVYVDDILIHSETLQEHTPLVRLALQILQENGLSCKPTKCKFEQTRIEYLGSIIEQGRVEMNLKKISAIVDWKAHKKIKEIQAFLGTLNEY
jgi:hypothetical protein